MHLLIGIDDTDNRESRGTGFLVRQLARQLEEQGMGKVNGITRHQLFVHDNIAYTSQNSAACLDVESEEIRELWNCCSDFLAGNAAEGSDAGLSLATFEIVGEKIKQWGKRAKKEILNLEEAIQRAKDTGIYLAGFTGTRIGQIGALAAIGLRKTGNDGRFIWLRGTGELRDFDSGVYTVRDLIEKAGINRIQTREGTDLESRERIFCNGWTRPVLRHNKSVLLVEKSTFADYDWKTIGKEYIRTFS